MSGSAAASKAGGERGTSQPDSGRGTGGRFLGFPLEGFGFFTSLLLAVSSGFFAFFLVTALSIFGLLVWNQMLNHAVNYANAYLYFGLPAAILVWILAFAVFGTLWVRARFQTR